MADITIAVCDDTACGTSPIMPYVGARFNGRSFTSAAKLFLSAALLRCGFDTVDGNPDSRSVDTQDLALRINRYAVDAAIVVSYAAFGSRKSFNDKRGFCVRFPSGRFVRKSKVFCEDICIKSEQSGRTGDVRPDYTFGAAGCPTAIVDAGYITCFDEAKLIYDTDFVVSVAEYIAMGVCEYFNMPYVRRDDIFSYPLLCAARRGKKVKMLQCLLDAYGYSLATDGVFGTETDAAVKKLCARNGRPKNEGVTAAVWRDLLLTALPELTVGSENNAVMYLQRKLYSKLYPVEIDGVFGEQTLSALNEFLAENVGAGFSVARDGAITDDIYKLLVPVGGGRPRLF